jgi:hypothetical protein
MEELAQQFVPTPTQLDTSGLMMGKSLQKRIALIHHVVGIAGHTRI